MCHMHFIFILDANASSTRIASKTSPPAFSTSPLPGCLPPLHSYTYISKYIHIFTLNICMPSDVYISIYIWTHTRPRAGQEGKT